MDQRAESNVLSPTRYTLEQSEQTQSQTVLKQLQTNLNEDINNNTVRVGDSTMPCHH